MVRFFKILHLALCRYDEIPELKWSECWRYARKKWEAGDDEYMAACARHDYF